MNKKVLMLGAVSCVAGIVTATAAGCSSSTTETTTNTPDATSDVKSERVVPEASDDDAGQCPDNVALTPADLDKDPGWKPGAASPGACTADDLTQFATNLKDTNLQTWKDLGTSLSGNCADCIITSTDNANWGPVVYTADSGGDKGFYNFGACFSVVESADCGKAVQYLEFCLNTACDTCATTQTDHDTCVGKAADTGGMCETFSATLKSSCKDLTASGKKCNTVGDAAKTLCGAPITDGGDGG
jgi:hypothetical protein